VFTGDRVAALHQGVGSESQYEFVRRFVVQYHRKIDSRKSVKNFSTLFSGSHRPARTFFFTRTSVALNADHQNVARRPGLFQQADMAGMQQVENAYGADHTLSIAFPLAPLENQLALGDNRQFPAPLRSFAEDRKQLILPRPPEWPWRSDRTLQNEYR
jgi:hypothetical protein